MVSFMNVIINSRDEHVWDQFSEFLKIVIDSQSEQPPSVRNRNESKKGLFGGFFSKSATLNSGRDESPNTTQPLFLRDIEEKLRLSPKEDDQLL